MASFGESDRWQMADADVSTFPDVAKNDRPVLRIATVPTILLALAKKIAILNKMTSSKKRRRSFLKAAVSALSTTALFKEIGSANAQEVGDTKRPKHAYRGLSNAVARTLQSKSDDRANIFDFIPAGQHAGMIARTSEYDCTAAFATAFAQASEIDISNARVTVDDTVEIGSAGHGQKTIKMLGGAEIHRPASANSGGPVIWFNHAKGSIIGSGKGSKISTAKEYAGDIILFGFAQMDVPLDQNANHCVLKDTLVEGHSYYGSAHAPLTAIRVCNPQLGGFSSYFHHMSGVAMQKTNNGLHLQGFGNGNRIIGLDGQWIGNKSLPDNRAFIYLDGAQQNFISGFWFHYSPGSTCLKFCNNNNMEMVDGFEHVPILNILMGHTEQDPAGASGGIGIYAPDSDTVGAIGNTIQLKDVCPAHNIGQNFRVNNDLDTLSDGPSYRRLKVWGDTEVEKLTAGGILTVNGAYGVSSKWLATDGFGVQTGENKRSGTAKLNRGKATVANTSVAQSDMLFLQRRIADGTVGDLTYSLNEGKGFTVQSASNSDMSVVEWELRERF